MQSLLLILYVLNFSFVDSIYLTVTADTEKNSWKMARYMLNNGKEMRLYSVQEGLS